jgi:hypothetical protein
MWINPGRPAPVLGRDQQLAQLGQWLGQDPPGGALLVLEGEPGIGKSTLWSEGIRRAGAAGWTVLADRAARPDAALSYAALADLLAAVPDADFGRLPPPQQRALRVALLPEDAPDGELDPRAVGTGLTGLLGQLSAAGPLLLAVDDAQWLDPASARALLFALRRLADRHVRMLATVRTEPGQRVARFPPAQALDAGAVRRLPVGPLTVAAMHRVFLRLLGGSFPRPLLVRVHAAAAGNPFYALEIAREIVLRGAPPASQPLPVPADHRPGKRSPRWPRPAAMRPASTWPRLPRPSRRASSWCGRTARRNSRTRCSALRSTPRCRPRRGARCTAGSPARP